MRTVKLVLADGQETRKGLGWLPDPPDSRDWTMETPKIQRAVAPNLTDQIPSKIDFRKDFTEVENQGNIGSCTACAAVALLEYHVKQRTSMTEDFSKLFVYKVTRNLLGWKGDTGAYIRTAMKALAVFGAPDESYWPYEIAKFDDEPTAFVYALAQNHQALQYYKVDSPGKPLKDVVHDMKKLLAQRQPVMFGFDYFDSCVNHKTGEIALPLPSERTREGHAVVCAGYDDDKVIKHPAHPNHSTKGAFIIRNSWGATWSGKEEGYGYIPYQYFMTTPRPLALDCWALLMAEILHEAQFNVDA